MKKVTMGIMFMMFAFTMVGCQRIETGEVGLRVGFDKQVDTTELVAGTFNQTLLGSVLTFPVREISMTLDNIQPQTKDNSTLDDMDVTVIYGIVPSQAGELYITKSRGMHVEEDGDIYLMYNYLTTIARSAAYKATQKYDAMVVTSARSEIESVMIDIMRATLKAEKLDDKIVISQVQVRNVQPSQIIINSANESIKAENDLKTAIKKVAIAVQEAARQTLLARPANLEYMKVQAQLNISEGVRDGKVQTVLIPHGLTMYGNVK